MRSDHPNGKSCIDPLTKTENAVDRPTEKSCRTDTQKAYGETVEYEILSGNETVVFIKAGAGGSARGYKNKYLKMARRVHKRIGATVICASNPDFPHKALDEREIRQVASEMGFQGFRLCLWGISDGAYQNLSLAKGFPETAEWIGVNSSFITFAEFEEKLQALPYVKKILVYGTEDDEYSSIPPAFMKNEGWKMLLIKGADHRFSGMLPQLNQTFDLIGKDTKKSCSVKIQGTER